MSKYLTKLIQTDQKIFTTQDLALLWGLNSKNTLYTTISRYIDKQILQPVSKGYYTISHLENIDRLSLITKMINKYSYLSCESVLFQNGIIFQAINHLTFISSVNKSDEVLGLRWKTRQLSDKFLYNNLGITSAGGYKIADSERAVADLLYYNPAMYFDARNLIDWDKVKFYQDNIYGNK